MNLNTNGLAEGFLNGFRTMADYQSQQKADQRADEQLQMQKDAVKDNKDYRDKSWNHMVEREDVQDSRYQDETKYNRERQSKLDVLNERQVNANITNDAARTGAYIKSSNANIETEKLRQQQLKFQQDQLDNQKWLSDNEGLLKSGYQAILSGQPVTEQQAAALSDNRAGNLNINKYADPNFVSNAKGLKQNVQGIMQNFTPEQFGTNDFYQKLNTPAIKQQMGVVFKDEINRNVGYVDSSGKRVVSKEFGGIVPVHTGDKAGVALEVIPVYEDGTKGEPQPVTVNRSSDPNDKVQVFAPSDLVGVINARANIANAIRDPQNLLQSINVIPAPDKKGYGEVVKEIDKSTDATVTSLTNAKAKAIGNTTTPDAAKTMALVYDQQIEQVKKTGETRKEEQKQYYGIGTAAQKQNSSSNQDSLKGVSEWVGSDPSKQAYYQALMKTGRYSPEMLDSGMLESGYQTYLQTSKDNMLEQQAIRNGRPNARTMGDVVVNGR